MAVSGFMIKSAVAAFLLCLFISSSFSGAVDGVAEEVGIKSFSRCNPGCPSTCNEDCIKSGFCSGHCQNLGENYCCCQDKC